MALIQEIEYVSKELYESLKGDKDYILIEDAEDNYSRVQDLFHNSYPADFSSLLNCLTRYLSFPVIEFDNKQQDFYNQIIIRIGNVFSLFNIYHDGNEYVVELLHKELLGTLELFINENLVLTSLSTESFDSRVFSKEDRSQELYTNEGVLDNESTDFSITEYKLMPSDSIKSGFQILSSDFGKIEEMKTRYLILEELGFIEHLKNNWLIEGDEVRRNEERTKKLLYELFGFDNFQTFRTYPRDFKNKHSSFVTKSQRQKVDTFLSNHKLSKVNKKG